MGEGKKRRSGEPLRENNDQKRRKEDDPPSPDLEPDALNNTLDDAEMQMVNQGGHKIKKVWFLEQHIYF